MRSSHPGEQAIAGEEPFPPPEFKVIFTVWDRVLGLQSGTMANIRATTTGWEPGYVHHKMVP
jgi:hypothetical protein